MHNSDYKFIKKPNLPQNKVKHCVISKDAKEAIALLNNWGIEVISVEKSNKLDEEIASHADLSFSYCDEKMAVISPNQSDLIKKMIELGCRVEVAEFEPFSPYPNDVLFNQTFLGDYFISKLDSASDIVKSIAKNSNLKFINTKQGYSKCSICIVNENAIITEDNGIVSLLKNSQIDVLKIEPDFIYLSDSHYGFLGGASGKLSKDVIFFNGNIEEHPSYLAIKEFLDLHNVKPVYDKSYKLTDIGSIIPITEQI
ncbi:MAG: hypothetical protein E7557_00815 [Ruminococcaceae bacterium]|nr:hypothetical protein [Oscillospiraceae bacterium]